MALHPGSLTSAYAALREGGFSASTMRNACERAQYRGTDTLGPYTVTFNREDGYQVSCRELAAEPASCRAADHADQMAAFGDCSGCGATELVPLASAPMASAAETPGTIASACAFGWSA